MSTSDLARTIERAREGIENSIPIARKTDLVTQRADDVLRRDAERDGASRAAARRERQRLNAGLFDTVKKLGIAIALVSIATIVIGLITPIGIFGFLAAVGVAVAAAIFIIAGGTRQAVVTPTVAPDLPNGAMVQTFDSYLYRVRRHLPPAAQAEVDGISALLPPLRQTLERVPELEPSAQDARRLMSKHLPGLIDSYVHVPAAYRGQQDAEGKSADDRLVEALKAGRQALKDIGEKLARDDLMKFETHGRFIENRYTDKPID
jgi:hypothetical protein